MKLELVTREAMDKNTLAHSIYTGTNGFLNIILPKDSSRYSILIHGNLNDASYVGLINLNVSNSFKIIYDILASNESKKITIADLIDESTRWRLKLKVPSYSAICVITNRSFDLNSSDT